VSSGTYRKYVYALAVELAEIPFNLLMAIVSWVIFYWIVSLDPRADKAIYNLLMVLAIFWAIPLFGQLFSFLSPKQC
jgi:ABC-type multidrug transport system permease subunit